jgi:uncharacterized protein (DUF924 family)
VAKLSLTRPTNYKLHTIYTYVAREQLNNEHNSIANVEALKQILLRFWNEHKDYIRRVGVDSCAI